MNEDVLWYMSASISIPYDVIALIAQRLLLCGQRKSFLNVVLCCKGVRSRIYRDNMMWSKAYATFFTAGLGGVVKRR